MVRPVRRIVTGHDAKGEAIIVADGSPARVYDQLGQPGLVFHEIWNTQQTPAQIDRDTAEAGEASLTLAPPAHGTRIRVLDIPPDTDEFDDEAAREVFEAIGGGDAHHGGKRHATMHRTRSIDYGIVLEGEITLLLDEQETVVRAGEIVVQRGTNHGWANHSGANCRIAFILIDGVFDADIV
ncbi:cupin domain-containing protein [Sphingomonas sp. AOB5]|uniref:cupin domain-containing protein n=1 Tax=Sphingomonas sp. AOB5 TaxID=3034017 RepID=UPI0023F72D83|nr:cupin domain-containing protein [Sphingomonas sp. AOB5]MDF7776082.1 cupin domain-containing protein [Sphingomonas sp. AOB5]